MRIKKLAQQKGIYAQSLKGLRTQIRCNIRICTLPPRKMSTEALKWSPESPPHTAFSMSGGSVLHATSSPVVHDGSSQRAVADADVHSALSLPSVLPYPPWRVAPPSWRSTDICTSSDLSIDGGMSNQWFQPPPLSPPQPPAMLPYKLPISSLPKGSSLKLVNQTQWNESAPQIHRTENGPQSSKRGIVHLACQPCRKRKTKVRSSALIDYVTDEMALTFQ